MKALHEPRCPVVGCRAEHFYNAAIENESPQHIGDKVVFVIQCEHGHIIAPSVDVQLKSVLEHNNELLAEILKAIKKLE